VFGTLHEPDAEARDRLAEVGVVGDHDADVGVLELPAPDAPEQVEQAVVLAGDHQRDALRGRGRMQPPAELQRTGHLAGERGAQRVQARLKLLEAEDHAQEEAPGLGIRGVLVGLDDVRALLKEEARDGGDDARAVGAHDDETTRIRAHGPTLPAAALRDLPG